MDAVPSEMLESSSVTLRLLCMKLFQRIATAYLPVRLASWRYQRGMFGHGTTTICEHFPQFFFFTFETFLLGKRSLFHNLQPSDISENEKVASEPQGERSEVDVAQDQGEDSLEDLGVPVDRIETIVDHLLTGLGDKVILSIPIPITYTNISISFRILSYAGLPPKARGV